MPSDQMIHFEGEVVEALPSRMYRVALSNGELVLTTVAGRARRSMRVLPGDRVQVEVSPYDLSRGRIVGPSSATA